jgi:alkylation response protein AidB-like acyl-CoA dehydrogenase
MTANRIISGNAFVEEQFGWMGTNLEAARAITYAAAELKAELDQHPTSKHLRLEAATLVNEAALTANRAFKVSLAKAAQVSIGEESLVHRIPKRHNHGDWGDQLLALDKEIGRYYLFL